MWLLLLVLTFFFINKKYDLSNFLNPQHRSSSEFNTTSVSNNILTYENNSYTITNVPGDDLSGSRYSNVAVEIGYGDRTYWGLTNSYGQLVYVIADSIVLQNDNTEAVNDDGRYYYDEAAVPGTELPDYDQGHVIADSLGGVSNAYNITPQDSTLNRTGTQSIMENEIRDAGGCSEFIAKITYPNTSTQIPESYYFEYVINNKTIIKEFNNK